MKVTKTETATKFTVWLTLDADPAERIQAAYRNGYFLPRSLVLTWHREGEDEWRLSGAKAHGPILKKDGSPGLQAGSFRFNWRGDLDDGAPDWAVQAVKENQP